MKKEIIIIIVILSCISLFANIIEIKKDGSGEYSTIQLGIDNASNGDTVLVYPGTYFENLLINEKAITLRSLDSDYKNTIIDGNKISSCIQIRGEDPFKNKEMETSYINGFTLRNGKGEFLWPNDNYRCGGGILIFYSIAYVSNCLIEDNLVSGSGGGINNFDSILNLSSVTVKNNKAKGSGGGINTGGLINSDQSMIIFDETQLCNIYKNYAKIGNDFCKTNNTPFINVVVDTFTVYNPSSYYLLHLDQLGIPQNQLIDIDMKHAFIKQIEQDLFVSPEGNDENNGLTAEEPLKSINYALNIIKADSLNHRTIHLDDGSYLSDDNEQWYPLHLKSYISLVGESMNNTIMVGSQDDPFLYDLSSKFNYTIKNLSFNNYTGYNNAILFSNPQSSLSKVNLKNIKISESFSKTSIIFTQNINLNCNNLLLKNNFGSHGLSLQSYNQEKVIFENCKIKSHQYWDYDDAQRSRAISLVGPADTTGGLPEFTFINTEISDCYDNEWLSDWSSAGIYTSWFLKLNLINCTIARNWGNAPAAYAVKIHDPNSIVNIYNSIIYRNAPHQIGLFGDPDWGEPIVLNLKNSLIEEGDDEIYDYYENSEINWLGGNLREDPLFVDDNNYDFNLSPESPCINAGTLDLPAGIEMPEFDLAGNPRIVDGKIDMGAYEYQGVSTNENIPKPTNIIKVFPNPSRMDYKNRDYLTTIYGKNIEKGRVKVEIFNIRGQKVKTLMDVFSYPSEFTLNWNGRNQQNKIVSSGQYFCKMVVNDKTYTERFIILK